MIKVEEFVNFVYNLSELFVLKDICIMVVFLEFFIQLCDFVFLLMVMWIIRWGRSNKEIQIVYYLGKLIFVDLYLRLNMRRNVKEWIKLNIFVN